MTRIEKNLTGEEGLYKEGAVSEKMKRKVRRDGCTEGKMCGVGAGADRRQRGKGTGRQLSLSMESVE